MISRIYKLMSIALFFMLISQTLAQQIITLTWNDVVGISRDRNLELKIQEQDLRQQELNEWKSMSEFLPAVNYQYQMINNVERPVFVIPNFGQVRFGTEYNFNDYALNSAKVIV